jgi:hypothetical protein
MASTALSASENGRIQLRISYVHHTFPEERADWHSSKRPSCLRECCKIGLEKSDPRRRIPINLGRDDLFKSSVDPDIAE